MIIAIDGPAASGKGTLARRLAAHLGYAHLDTGRLYRAVALAVLRAGADPRDVNAATAAARGLDVSRLDDPALADDEVGQAASVVAAFDGVRAALLEAQRRFAEAPPDGRPGAVLDGRDIGTVVCPGADIKLFVTADVGERAQRRLQELRQRGDERIYARVLAEIEERDHRDRTRSVAPLQPSPDAIIVDTSGMTVDEVFRTALSHVASRGGAASASTRRSDITRQ